MVGAGLIVGHIRRRWPALIVSAQCWAPRILVMAVVAAAAYAYAFREPAGRLAAHDAYALRVFGWYIGPVGLAAAVAGFAAVAWARFWKDPVLLTTGALVSGFFFYKIRIVPENFWQARRYLAVILPFACVMMAAGAFSAYRHRVGPSLSPVPLRARMRAALLYLAPPLAVLVFVGWTFVAATRPILNHVEYAGLIPALERIAGEFGPRDLVLIEPRYSSDTHVLATPLAYIYAKNVLLFSSPRPGRAEFGQFLAWAGQSYARVFLIAEGGLDLASPSVGITPIRNERFSIPEYESARNAYPREVRQKKFNLNIYQLQVVDQAAAVTGPRHRRVRRPVGAAHVRAPGTGWRHLPVGAGPLVRHPDWRAVLGARDRDPGWGRRPAGGGRPCRRRGVPERSRGREVHGPRRVFRYRLDVPPDVAAAAAARATAEVRLASTTWAPKDFLGGSDDRPLGIMLDRIRVE